MVISQKYWLRSLLITYSINRKHKSFVTKIFIPIVTHTQLYHSQRNYGETESKTNKIVWHKLRIFIFFFIDFFFHSDAVLTIQKNKKYYHMLFHNSINFQSFVQITPTKTGEKKDTYCENHFFFTEKHILSKLMRAKKKFFYTNQHQFF